MPPVSERLRSHSLIVAREFSEAADNLTQALTVETEIKRGHQAADQAIEFMRTSGIKLALMEFNQDALKENGSLTTNVFSTTDEYDNGEKSLFYSAEMMLRWKKGLFLPTYYTLFATISGNLYKGHLVGGKSQHKKTLSIDLMESPIQDEIGTSNGLYVDYGNHFFDTEAPTDEVVEIKNWAEANIAHLINRKSIQNNARIY